MILSATRRDSYGRTSAKVAHSNNSETASAGSADDFEGRSIGTPCDRSSTDPTGVGACGLLFVAALLLSVPPEEILMPQSASSRPGTTPYWADSASLPTFPKVVSDQRVDVVVVGGGITGLTAAYLITMAGKTVALLERGQCAQIDTGHTSAHLTMVTDRGLVELVKQFGRDHGQAVWDGGLAAIAQIDALVREHDIDCDFNWIDGYLHTSTGDESTLASEAANDREAGQFREEATLASELGFDAEFVDDVPLVGGPGVRFDSQARFHPRQYLAGLARAITSRGGRIYEHSEVAEFQDQPLSVKANGFTVTCDDIVVATHNPLVGVSGLVSATVFQTKLALYTSYVVAGRVAHGQVPDALFWDTADPYHYLRIEAHGDFDVVIFGGEDHKTGQMPDTAACYDRLERTLLGLIPEVELTHRWSGQVIESPDGLPYIGRMAEHQYAATAFSGNGMTFGTLAAMIMSDAILGRKNPWSELFDPGRAAIRGGLWDYLKENTDYPYYLIRDRLAGGHGGSLRSVKRGQGQVITRNGAQVAAYRDRSGSVSLRSAVCTHAGCAVAWNGAEQTWDCPCHGSRFKPNGDVISGPAESPLPEAQ
jgi:glycine/D-amino acid oxidase-like deaminating enzyme/nitrite reductase/ring-hydroxylating ferredoxin subunit